MTGWQQEFHGIPIRYENEQIFIQSGEALLDFLAGPRVDSYRLASYVYARYYHLYKTPLSITRASLSVEILGHVYIEKGCVAAERLLDAAGYAETSRMWQYVEATRLRAHVIECGPREVDRHRADWDFLSLFRRCIYRLCGQNA